MFSDYKPYTRHGTKYFIYMTSFNPHHFLLLIPFCWWGDWAIDSLSIFPKSDKFNRSELRASIFCALDFISKSPNRSAVLGQLLKKYRVKLSNQVYIQSVKSIWHLHQGSLKMCCVTETASCLLAGEVGSVIYAPPPTHPLPSNAPRGSYWAASLDFMPDKLVSSKGSGHLTKSHIA